MSAAGRRIIPVYVVLAPQTLLLDVAGPLEVLRKANDEQRGIRFENRFVGPRPVAVSSVGLTLSNIEPLPDKLPDNAFIILPGTINASDPDGEAGPFGAAEQKIVAWLGKRIKPDQTLI
jgi:transcriptional regulator GlxA family with amidase domain